jgi:hypothetical protein
MRITLPALARLAFALAVLGFTGCSGNVGVGLNVGIPIGDHGYISVGSGRWL